MTKELYNVNQNETYMPIERKEAYKRGFKKTDISIKHIGTTNEACITVECTAEYKKWWETRLDTEARANLRSKRCLIPDGKGGFIHCPDKNKCHECKKTESYRFSNNHPLSLDQLTTPETEEDKTIDIAGKYLTESDIIALITREEIKEYLRSFEGERYDEIFQMLYDEYSVKEIAEELGVPWITAKDKIKKVRALAQAYISQ